MSEQQDQTQKTLLRRIEELMGEVSQLAAAVNHYQEKHRSYYALNRAWAELEDARDFIKP